MSQSGPCLLGYVPKNWIAIGHFSIAVQFPGLQILKRVFPPFSSFLRNGNRTIFGWDIGKNVNKDTAWALGFGGGAFIGGFSVYRSLTITTYSTEDLWQSTGGKWWLTHWASLLRWIWSNWPSKMRSGIVHHKSDRKPCVIPTADRNKIPLRECMKIKYCCHESQMVRRMKTWPNQIKSFYFW